MNLCDEIFDYRGYIFINANLQYKMKTTNIFTPLHSNDYLSK